MQISQRGGVLFSKLTWSIYANFKSLRACKQEALKEMSAKKQLQNHSVTYTFYVKFLGFEANFSKIYQYIWELRDNGVVKNLQFRP